MSVFIWSEKLLIYMGVGGHPYTHLYIKNNQYLWDFALMYGLTLCVLGNTKSHVGQTM